MTCHICEESMAWGEHHQDWGGEWDTRTSRLICHAPGPPPPPPHLFVPGLSGTKPQG